MKKFLAALFVLSVLAISVLSVNAVSVGAPVSAATTGLTPVAIGSTTAVAPLAAVVAVTAPTVSLTAPANGATVSGTIVLSANASDAKKIRNVQFQVDGVRVSSNDTTAPYGVNWNTKNVADGNHVITAIATNSTSLKTTSDSITVIVNNNTDKTAPTVAISSPANGATVSGTAVIAVTANDNVGIKRVVLTQNGAVIRDASVQNNYGWGSRWGTTNVADGSYTIKAVAYDAAGNTSSNSITVIVKNTVTPVAPTVSVTTPAANATVAGNVTITAAAGGTQPITGVQFKLDGVNLGTADTTAPYSISWNAAAASNGVHTITAVATNSALLSTTSAPVSVTVNNPTAPTVAITAPANAASLVGTTTVTANAGGNTAIKNVQFKLDGVNLGTADTTAPYSIAWDTTTATNGAHTLTAVATNTANLATTSSSVSVTVNNPTAPTVAITLPLANATLSGATNTLTATAGGAQAITSLQFKLDGVNVGAAATTAPYSINFDTTAVANGVHSLTAVATNSANLTTTSAPVSVTVSNQVVIPPVVPVGPNLILNPSVETAQSDTAPQSWLSSNWGNNSSAFTYLPTGHTGSRSVEVQTLQYTDGAANWYYADIPVAAGKTYQYSNWYKSNVDTEVDAEVVMNDGSVQYFWLGAVFANSDWTKFSTTFTPPAGAKSIAIYQILAKVGYIISDDYSLTEYTPQPLTRGIVSVTFDDGWANQYANATPVMQQLGLKATYYIISGELDDTPDYMTSAQVKSLYTAGNEIGSHSVTHPDLTTLSAANMQSEMANSKTTLQNLIGAPVTDFAYPFGAYNAATILTGKSYYNSQRTVSGGYNTKDNFEPTMLKIYEVDSNISQAQVQGWIDGAIAQHAWLILVFHEVATTPSAPDDALYTTQPSDFTAEMNYLKNSGVTVETVNQALNEIQSQL